MTHKINVSKLSCCILLHRLSQNIRHVLDLVMQHFSFGSDWTAESQLSSLPPQRLLLTWQRLVSCTISTFLQLACISRCPLTTVCFCFVLRDPGWDVLVHMPVLSDSYSMRTAFLMMLSERYWQSIQSCSAGHLVSLCRNWAGEMALCALRTWLFQVSDRLIIRLAAALGFHIMRVLFTCLLLHTNVLFNNSGVHWNESAVTPVLSLHLCTEIAPHRPVAFHQRWVSDISVSDSFVLPGSTLPRSFVVFSFYIPKASSTGQSTE